MQKYKLFGQCNKKSEKMTKKSLPNKRTYADAVLFAKERGFDGVTYAAEYKGCAAYHANSKALEGASCGYPHFVIADGNGKCRFSTPDEALEIIDLIEE